MVAQGVLVAATLAAAVMTPAGASTNHTLTIKTAQVPKVGLVLTTNAGLTLYHLTSDPTGTSTCTGACAQIWLPLLLPKGDHLHGPRGLKGLSTIHVAHGRRQVAFHGAALYHFTGDTKLGQAKGQGVAGMWFAVLRSGIPAAAHVLTPASPPVTVTPPSSAGTTPGTTPATTPPPSPATTPATMTPSTQPPITQPPTTQPPTTQPPSTTTPTTAPATGGAGF
jgi:predicted lipoprotein with Yx(FWY)xxD motif